MLKEPRFGRVKTRLAKDIGAVDATWWFRHQTASLLRKVGPDPRWKTVLSISPDQSAGSRFWPPEVTQVPQGSGDLGDRMRRMFQRFRRGPTLIIGGDIPGINQTVIWSGFKALGSSEAVFGPATDGGYWLIGLKGGGEPVPQNIFQNVRWSTEHALSDTVNTFGPTARIAKIACLEDIDTAADLMRHLSRSRKPALKA